jgi:hypothetical protein
VAVGKLQHDLDQLRYIHVPNQLNPSTLRTQALESLQQSCSNSSSLLPTFFCLAITVAPMSIMSVPAGSWGAFAGC